MCPDPDVPAPESVPPINNPDPQPGDPKPKAPPSEDESRPQGGTGRASRQAARA